MDAPDIEPDEEVERIEASMTATEFFRSLELRDSKRVDNWWYELENSVLEIANLNGKNQNKRRLT